MKTNEEVLIEMTEEPLTGAVNFYLGEFEVDSPLFEVDCSRRLGSFGVWPDIEVCECELSDKERIIKVVAYTLKIALQIHHLSEKKHLYFYTHALDLAINDDPTFGGVADRVSIVYKKYKQLDTGAWEIVIMVRVIMEVLQ
jgi:hypothetical protein